MNHNNTNGDEFLPTDHNNLLGGTSCNQFNALQSFHLVLQFLSHTMARKNTTDDQYLAINNDFIRKPYSYNTSLYDFLATLTPLLYNDTGNLSQMVNDFNKFVILRTNDSDDEPRTKVCSKGSLEDTFQHEFVQSMVFWTEGIFQSIVGIIGIVSNIVAIPILCRPSMKSIFNKLLICLLILHTIYICGVISMEIIWPWLNNGTHIISDLWLTILFSYVLHPLQPLMLYSSTFITMLMARQRCLAIRHPIEYRNSNLTVNPWVPAMKSLSVVLVTATVLTFPLFFESSVETKTFGTVQEINKTHFQYVLAKDTNVKLEPIRFHPHYVLWYRNISVLIASLIIPFALLAYWNFNTLSVILRRRRLKNRPSIASDINSLHQKGSLANIECAGGSYPVTNSAAAQVLNSGSQQGLDPRRDSRVEKIKREEARKAQILFAIVIIFVVCNVLRIILNMEELAVIAPSYSRKIANERNEEMNDQQLCYSPPFWAHILGIISKFLLTVNASVCCFVYCVMSPTFREEISKALINLMSRFSKIIRSLRNNNTNMN